MCLPSLSHSIWLIIFFTLLSFRSLFSTPSLRLARSFVRSFVSLFGFCSLFIMCTYFHLHDFCLILKTIQFAKVVFHTSIRVLVPASS